MAAGFWGSISQFKRARVLEKQTAAANGEIAELACTGFPDNTVFHMKNNVWPGSAMANAGPAVSGCMSQGCHKWGLCVLNLFRAASIAEGLSFLVILSVSLGLISRDHVFLIGMTHGVLFLVYMLLSLWVSNSRNWSVLVWLLIFLAAVVPFAFIGVELFLRREEQNRGSQPEPA